MTGNGIKTQDYHQFLTALKERIRRSQYEALKAVNKELITLYWDIGKMIVERQEKHKWGRSVVENLAADLQKEFPGLSGYSKDNLWRMRKFYLHFKDHPKLAPLVQVSSRDSVRNGGVELTPPYRPPSGKQ